MRLIGLLFATLLAGCGAPPLYQQQAFVFGTLVEVSIYGEPAARAKAATERILAEFDTLHRQLHAWEPGPLDDLNAEISKAPTTGTLPDGLAPILADATRLAAQSEHLFNPAIGNLVRLWGFHHDSFAAQLPPDAAVRALVAARPRMSDLVLDNGRFRASNPAVRLDLGGYAKGYALDRAAAHLREAGIANALVNIGGNIRAFGQRGDRPWRVGIQHPRAGGALATLTLRDGEAIGTSGDYQRFFELDGRRYCHLIDPRDGQPVRHTQAVTVIARGPAAGTLSDVASKPIFIAGPADWRRQANQMGVSEVLRIDADGHLEATRAMAERLEWPATPPPLRLLN